MISIDYYFFLIVLGSVAGYIGLIGEATAITQRSFMAALLQGAGLCLFTSGILAEVWPGHIVTTTMIGFMVGICRWNAIKPVANIGLKLLLDFGRALISNFKTK